MEAPSVHSGGVDMIYREAEHFYIEALHIYRENIVSLQLASGNMQRSIVG